jgi:hypothetical protein
MEKFDYEILNATVLNVGMHRISDRKILTLRFDEIFIKSFMIETVHDHIAYSISCGFVKMFYFLLSDGTSSGIIIATKNGPVDSIPLS